jgi:hypothetical protein
MNAAYVFVFSSLVIERFCDPLTIVPAVLTGILCRRWLHVALIALAIAVAAELARYVSNFHPAILVLGWLAAVSWASAAYLAKRWFSGRAPSR